MAVKCVNFTSGAAVNAASSGVLGYLGARIFTSIDPLHGGVFGVVSALVSSVTKPLFEKIFEQPGADENAKCVGQILNTVVGIAVSLSICGALGFQLTLETAVILIISQIAAVIVGSCALVLCCGACAAGAP